jgi:PAS domain S-box-containing protein
MAFVVLQPSQNDPRNRSVTDSTNRNDPAGASIEHGSSFVSKTKLGLTRLTVGDDDESRHLLSSLVDDLPAMPYRCRLDPDWTLEFVGAACIKIIGYSHEELVENRLVTFVELIHPDDREAARADTSAAWLAGRAYDLTYRIIARSGEVRWVRDIGLPVQTSNNGTPLREGYIMDMTGRIAAERQVKSQLNRLEALRTIDSAITASYDLRVTFDIVLQQIALQLGVDAADLLLLSKSDETLKYVAGRGFRTETLKHTNLRVGEGYAGKAALERQLVRVPDLADGLGELRRSPHLSSEGFVSYFGVPLIARGQVKGILELFQRSPLNPDRDWLAFMNALAGQAAIAIDNASLLNDLQRSNTELELAYDDTLEGWSRALEMREWGTEGHNRRVTELALRLAQVFLVKDNELVQIRRGAFLHDIGKLAIPDQILYKNSALSEDEWLVMRLHPVHAYQLLSPIRELRQALDIPYCHHEKWDGSGYPRGIKETQIPVGARLFAIVDVWDALLSDRPFRPAWEKGKVLDYMRSQAGKHFDPDMLKAFLQMID